MKIIRYSIQHKDYKKEWSVSFGTKQEKAVILHKFMKRYNLPFLDKPTNYIVKEVNHENN